MNLLRTIELSCSEVICPGGWEAGIDMTLVGELAKDLRAGKILPPIKVTMGHRLVAGRHRLKAHMVLGLKRVRADVIQYESPEEAEEDGLLENLRRRVLPPEEHDKALVRLWEIIRGRLTQEPRQMSDAPQSAPAPVAEPTKNAVDVAVAEKAAVHPRTVERARAREKQRAAPPATKSESPKESPLPESHWALGRVETAAQAEDAFLVEHGRKRRARALKRMAELLRKVEECLPNLEGMREIDLDPITNRVDALKQAIWFASVAEGREDSPGAGAEPEVTTASGDVRAGTAWQNEGRTGGSIPPTGALHVQRTEPAGLSETPGLWPVETVSRREAERLFRLQERCCENSQWPTDHDAGCGQRRKTLQGAAPPKPRGKRLRIEGPDGKPLDPDED